MSLTITPDQTEFTAEQLAALDVDAGTRELAVLLHIVQRTRLDPFAGQIRMFLADGRWVVQAGIDGLRLVGRRAADESGESIEVDGPLWGHPEDGWVTAWRSEWGNPVAASVTIRRGTAAVTGVALFDEYAAGGNTWQRRPAGQLAKCAEALAWRMAFPQDLSGVYTDDELAHTRTTTHAAPAPRRSGGVTAAEILGGAA